MKLEEINRLKNKMSNEIIAFMRERRGHSKLVYEGVNQKQLAQIKRRDFIHFETLNRIYEIMRAIK